MSEAPLLSDRTDAELVGLACENRSDAFDVIAMRYLGVMHAVALARLCEREAAEDLVQEVLIHAYLNLGRLEEPEKVGPWLTSIARNTALNWLKAGRRRSAVLNLVPLDDVGDTLADPEQKGARVEMQEKEARTWLEKAIDSLEPDERELVLLYYSEELSKAEIARQTGLHRATVGRRLDRAFSSMRSELEPVLREEGRKLRPSKKFQARTLLVISAAAALSAETKSAIAATSGTVAVTQASAAMAAIGTGAAFATDAAMKGSILMTLKAKIVALVAAVGLLGGIGFVVEENHEPAVKRLPANVVFSEMGRYQFSDGGYIMSVEKTADSKMNIRWKDPDSTNYTGHSGLEKYRWIMCWDEKGRIWVYHPQLLIHFFYGNDEEIGQGHVGLTADEGWNDIPSALKKQLPKQFESIYQQVVDAYGGNTMHIPIDKEILDKITVDIEPLASSVNKVSSTTLTKEEIVERVKEREKALSGLSVNYNYWLYSDNENFVPDEANPDFAYQVRFLLHDGKILQYIDSKDQREGKETRGVYSMDAEKGYSVYYDARQVRISGDPDAVTIRGTAEPFRRATCFLFAPYLLSDLLRSESKILSETPESVTVQVTAQRQVGFAPYYHITFDRTKGFAVRSAEVKVIHPAEDGGIVEVTAATDTVEQFTQTDDGVWLPVVIREKMPPPEPVNKIKQNNLARVEKIGIDSNMTPQDFTPEIPDGFGMTNEIRRIKYKADGANSDSSRGDKSPPEKDIPTTATIEAFGKKLIETAASGDKAGLEKFILAPEDLDGYFEYTPEEVEWNKKLYRLNLHAIEDILSVAGGAEYQNTFLGEMGEIKKQEPGNPQMPNLLKSGLVTVQDIHISFKVQSERWEMVITAAMYNIEDNFRMMLLELQAKPEKGAQSGKTYAQYYRNSGDGYALLSTLITEVKSGDSIEDLRKLLGPNVRIVTDDKILEQQRKATAQFAEKYPGRYPDGFQNEDQFLECPNKQGSLGVYLQLRNGHLINHTPETIIEDNMFKYVKSNRNNSKWIDRELNKIEESRPNEMEKENKE